MKKREAAEAASRLMKEDRAFCVSHGMKYIPPDPPISLDEFESEQHYQNQGPANPHKMWTIGANRYERDDSQQEPDTTTSTSEFGMMIAVGFLLLVIAAALMQG